jgi:hypothetical protein
VDLTLRDGTNLQDAIQTAQEIDQQSKALGFNQAALDQTAWQGYSNARFEVNGEEGLDLVEEFYAEENQETDIEYAQPETKTRAEIKSKSNQREGFVQEIQKGLQQNVRAVN